LESKNPELTYLPAFGVQKSKIKRKMDVNLMRTPARPTLSEKENEWKKKGPLICVPRRPFAEIIRLL
jgi:hypothetical protein